MVPKALLAKLLPRKSAEQPAPAAARQQPPPTEPNPKPRELGGPAGPEPTRYGDWERNGRCIDF
jgi:hypothetical protein